MGMNRTLLDYLLNRVDEADAREFQRVLAMQVTGADWDPRWGDQSEWEQETKNRENLKNYEKRKEQYPGEQFEKNLKEEKAKQGAWPLQRQLPKTQQKEPQLLDWLSNIYGGDQKKEQNFISKVSEVLFGKSKSVFEMTPEELERLTRLSLTSKEVADFELHIQPEMLSEQGREKDSKDMEYIVNKFYLDNKLYFESPDDLQFDPDTWMLEYKGRKRLAKKLLQQMGVQDKYVGKTVDKGSKGSVSLKIPLIDLVDTDDPKFEDINQETADEIENELHQIAGRDVQVEVVPGKAVASVTAAPKDQLAEREKFNQKNIQKQQQPKPSFWGTKKKEEPAEEDDPKQKPGGLKKPEPAEEPETIIDPQLKLKGHKMDIYNVLKKSQLLDQHKVDQIFDGDLRKYMSN